MIKTEQVTELREKVYGILEQLVEISALQLRSDFLSAQLKLHDELTEARSELFLENVELRADVNSRDAKIVEMEKWIESALDDVERWKARTKQLLKKLREIKSVTAAG